MVKANDLIKEQKKRKEIKIESFKKVFQTIEKKIILASASEFYYLWYEVPEFILGLPTYKLSECVKYSQDKLEADNFKCTFYEPNILLITWFPENE